jgi:hypothetical protein
VESVASHSRLNAGSRAAYAVFAGQRAPAVWCCRLRCCALGLLVHFATWLRLRALGKYITKGPQWAVRAAAGIPTRVRTQLRGDVQRVPQCSADQRHQKQCGINLETPNCPEMQIASEAGMRYAGEVYQPEGRKGAPPAGEGEASREERRRARAAKKRAGKKRTAQKVL